MFAFRILRKLSVFLLPCLVAAAHSQEVFPSKPIRIVIGFAAGGGTDVVLRAISHKMATDLGTTILVDNKPGANGNLAADFVVKSKADGYTLLYNTSSIVTSPALYPTLSYDFQKDLTPVGLAVNVPLVLVVAPSLRVTTLRDFITQAKARPGAMSYASGGNGNITHLANVLFQRVAGISSVHIPYKGESQALSDLAGGHVQFYMGTAAGVAPLVKSGGVIALAVTSLKRLPNLPDVPTLTESGLSAIELGSWSGLMAPAGTPSSVIQKLNKALSNALTDSALVATLSSQSAEVKVDSPTAYGSYLNIELQRWGTLIKSQKIVSD